MKIFYDYQIYFNQKFGGPSRYFIELHKSMLQLNQDPITYLPFHINNHIKNLNLPGIKEKIFSNRKFKLNPLLKFYNKRKTLSYIKKFNPDIVHPTYYDAHFYKNVHATKIVTVYDLIHEKYRELYGLSKDYLPKKEAINASDFFLCPSKCTQQDLIENYKVKKEQTAVVYWAPFMSSKKKPFKNLTKTKPYILYVGNRHAYKNAKLMMESISCSREAMKEFDIIFFGGGQFNKSELELFKNLNFKESQIHQVNGSDEKLVELYQNATTLVYPSLYEGLGLPIFEAMQFDCPVITSYSSGMIEAGGNAVEYFDPTDTESIKNSIEKVLFSKEKQNELISLGRERIKNFSWKKVGKETLNIYKTFN